jgi:hypothetical protein
MELAFFAEDNQAMPAWFSSPEARAWFHSLHGTDIFPPPTLLPHDEFSILWRASSVLAIEDPAAIDLSQSTWARIAWTVRHENEWWIGLGLARLRVKRLASGALSVSADTFDRLTSRWLLDRNDPTMPWYQLLLDWQWSDGAFMGGPQTSVFCALGPERITVCVDASPPAGCAPLAFLCVSPPCPSEALAHTLNSSAPSTERKAALWRWLHRRLRRIAHQFPELACLPEHLALRRPAWQEMTDVMMSSMALAVHYKDARDGIWQVLGQNMLPVSVNELGDPSRWANGLWLADAPSREHVSFPTATGFRWARQLDLRALTQLWIPLPKQPKPAHYTAMALLCEFLGRTGNPRLSRHQARILRGLPLPMVTSMFAAAHPRIWQSMLDRDISLPSSPHLIDARSKLETNPAMLGLGHVIAAYVRAPQRRVGQNALQSRDEDMRVWEWITDGAEALSWLATVRPNTPWPACVRAYLSWAQASEQKMYDTDLGLDGDGVRWHSALGQVSWDGVVITPICRQERLAAAGHRFLNCLRSEGNMDLSSAVAGHKRYFTMVKDGESAMLSIERTDHERWSVQQVRASANRSASPELAALAERVAQTYGFLDGDTSSSGQTVSPSLGPTQYLSQLLAAGLHGMGFQGARLSSSPKIAPLTIEELCTPDGCLGLIINEAKLAGVVVHMEWQAMPATSPTCLLGGRPIIQCSMSQAPLLASRLLGFLKSMKDKSPSGTLDIDIDEWLLRFPGDPTISS